MDGGAQEPRLSRPVDARTRAARKATRMTRTRSEQLADALEACRPWSDELAVAAALARWSDSVPWVDAHGKQTSAPDPADVAEELRFVGRAEPTLDAATVAAITAGMLVNVAANRSATDYASPFASIRGLRDRTSRRYRQPMRRRAVEGRRKAALARYFDAEARHRTATTTADRATARSRGRCGADREQRGCRGTSARGRLRRSSI